jgi:hypothetical protein
MKNKFLHIAALSAITLLSVSKSQAQNGGSFSGDLMMNANFYQRDSAIGANNDLYNHNKSGGEGWLGLRYSNYGFTGYLRLDVFNNSNLRTLTSGFTGFGIGAWSISKEVKGLTITGGYIYDQVGSGVIFRSYEDRGLLIDNALEGLHLKYKLDDHIVVKAFMGQQKNYFDRFASVLKGASAEGDYQIGENVHLTPGVGIVNRTLDDASYNSLYNTLGSYHADSSFTPMYNTYAMTAYNTLSIGNFTWYAEGAYKTHEAIKDNSGKLVDKAGNVQFTTLGYAIKGFALNVTGKRTQNFVMNTTVPDARLPNSGMINWQPIVAQIRTQRLIARYTPASQDLSEKAVNTNMIISPNANTDLNFSGTYINTLENQTLYREGYFEANIRSVKSFLIDVGAQYMQYNIGWYQHSTFSQPIMKAFTPFTEITYLFNAKRSIKMQAQYMNTKQDHGSWAFLQLEYVMAPKWSFVVSDMLNVDPITVDGTSYKNQHFYNFFVSYTKASTRFSVAYVKQVDGINCTGGVCRYEPAFNGLKVSLTSSF